MCKQNQTLVLKESKFRQKFLKFFQAISQWKVFQIVFQDFSTEINTKTPQDRFGPQLFGVSKFLQN